MAIKVYRGVAQRSAIPPGGIGVSGWFRAFSPGNRMRLLRVQIVFNSYNQVNNEWDNPINDRFNYFNADIDNSTLPNPFVSMNNSIVDGSFYEAPTMFFNTPGSYPQDIMFQDQIWMSFFSYNYAAAGNRSHSLAVNFTVDETPLNQ